ncbi:hypothetical protein [Asticcacaulis sp.]|uniref:hypothetical protein n=1 Tax=Asticcacaulis sp. TaxID=1872648 RepID=UPI00260F92F6|nr:hypothetical protein [Asticcacaulis sp.]
MTETMREVLRRLENTFRPEISDEMLLAVYLEVSNYDEPDVENVFSDIHEEVRRTIMERMGADDPDTVCGGIPYDYPAQGAEALQFLITNDLPPEKLLFMLRLSAGSIGDEWKAIHDLCRARIIRRIDNLPHFEAQSCTVNFARHETQNVTNS